MRRALRIKLRAVANAQPGLSQIPAEQVGIKARRPGETGTEPLEHPPAKLAVDVDYASRRQADENGIEQPLRRGAIYGFKDVGNVDCVRAFGNPIRSLEMRTVGAQQ